MDQELIAYLDGRFRETSQQFEGLRQEMNQRFEQMDQRFEAAAETARHTVILVEGLRHEVHLVAEGFMGLTDKLEWYQSGMDARYAEVRASIDPYYRDLNKRVSILEEKAEREHSDVMDGVRKMLGKLRQEPR